MFYNKLKQMMLACLTGLAIVAFWHPQHSQAQTWDEAIKAIASDRAGNDNFGYSVSISGDYAIVGAVYDEDADATTGSTQDAAGSAYIFERNISGSWVQQQKLVASDRAEDDQFGVSVAISGSYAIVGASFEDQDADATTGSFQNQAGSAYIFERNSSAAGSSSKSW